MAERPAVSKTYVGLEESLALARQTLQEHGPFDGLLGKRATLTLVEVRDEASTESVLSQLPEACEVVRLPPERNPNHIPRSSLMSSLQRSSDTRDSDVGD